MSRGGSTPVIVVVLVAPLRIAHTSIASRLVIVALLFVSLTIVLTIFWFVVGGGEGLAAVATTIAAAIDGVRKSCHQRGALVGASAGRHAGPCTCLGSSRRRE